MVIAGLSLCAGEPNEKAQKYLQVLLKRPSPGYLFDRFYNAWLDTESVEGLEAFLLERAKGAEGATYDLLLALLQEKNGEYVKALKHCQQATKKQPNSPNILYYKASLEASTLGFEQALKDLQAALAANPEGALREKILKLLGKTCVRNGDTKKGLAVWQQLLAAAPDDDDLRDEIIELQLEEGLFQEALSECDRFIAATKDKYKAVMLSLRRAEIYQRLNQKEKALTALSGALDRVGRDTWLEKEIFARIERVFRAEDDITGLRTFYEKLLKAAPKHTSLMARQAAVLHEAGETEQAIAAVRELIRLTPLDRTHKERLLEFLINADQHEAALQHAQALVKAYPKDSELLVQLARIQHKAGKPDDCRATLRRYLDQSDKGEYDYLRVARLMGSFRLEAAATALYAEMAKTFPESIECQEARAAHLYTIGKKDEARQIHLSLAEKGDEETVLRSARSLMARKDPQAAYDLLKKRLPEFGKGPSYLEVAFQAASALKLNEEAFGYARQRVGRVTSPVELRKALLDAGAAAERQNQAEALIRELQAKDEPAVAESCLLSELLYRTGDQEAAQTCLAKALGRHPDAVLVLGQQYDLARRTRDWPRAAEVLKRMLPLQPARRTATIRELVEILLKDLRHEEAVHWIAEWKKASPGSTLPYVQEAKLHAREYRNDKAIETLRAAVLKFPDNVDLKLRLADYYVMDGKYSDAERLQWRLLEDAKDLPERLRFAQELINLAQIQGGRDRLMQHFETRMRTNRTSLFPVLALARLHRSEGNYEEHRKYLLKASQMRADDVSFLHEIARIEEEEGDYERALATLKQAAQADKTDRSQQLLIRHHLKHGDEDKGYQLLIELAGGKGMDVRSAEDVATTLLKSQRYDLAVSFLKSVLPSHPRNYRLGFLYAVAFEETQDYAGSVDAFVSLLDVKDELPTARKPAVGGQRALKRSWLGVFERILPEETFRFFELQFARHLLYTYRQPGRGHTFGPFGLGQSVPAPNSIEELPTYVLGHLAQISRGLDDDERQDLSRRLTAKGVAYAELKLSFDESLMRSPAFWDSALEKHGDDEAIMALRIFSTFGNMVDVPEGFPQKAFEVFKDKRPELAAMAGFSLRGEDEESEALFRKALALLATIETPNELLFFFMVEVSSERAALSDELKKEMHATLLKALPKVKSSGMFGMSLTPFVAGMLLSAGDYQNLVALLNQRMREPDRKGGGGLAMFMGSRSSHQPLAHELGFPPQALPGFPAEVLAVLAGNMGFGRGGREIDPDELWPHVASVEHPMLKTILTSLCDKPEEAGALVGKLLEKPKPSLAELVLAAAWKGGQGDDEEAVSILNRARYLPMDQTTRRTVDGAIIAYAAKAGEKEPVTQAARAAILRMRAHRLSLQEKTQLADLMEQFGLNKEAEKLDASLAAAPTAIPTRSSSYVRHVSPSSPHTVAALFQKGEREKAVKSLARDFRSLALSAMSVSGLPGGAISAVRPRDVERLVQVILANNAERELLEQLTPPADSTNPRSVFTLAFAYECLNKHDQAIREYERVVKHKADHAAANLRLALLLVEKDEKRAGEHLTRSVGRNLDGIGQMLAQRMGNEHILSRRLKFVPLVKHLLRIEGQRYATYPWLQQVWSVLEQRSQGAGTNVPGLFEKRGGQSQKLSPAVAEIAARRRKDYDELCDLAASIPALAEAAFARKQGLLAFLEEEQAPLYELAKQILAGQVKRRPASSPHMMVLRSYGHGLPHVERLEPAHFLVSYAFTKGKRQDLEAFIKQLESGETSNRETIKRLQAIKKLYETPEGRFLEAAKSFKLPSQPAGFGPFMGPGTYTIIVRAWADTDRKASLTPLVIDTVKDAAKSRRFHDMSFAARWARQLWKAEGSEPTQRFLEELDQALFSEREREELKEVTDHMSLSRRPVLNMKLSVYSQALQQLVRDREMLFLGLDQVQRYRSIMHFQYVNQQAGDAVRRRAADWDWLKASPFLRDWDDFRFYSFQAHQGSLFQQVVQSLASHQDKKEIVKQLKALKPQTFGSGLLLVSLEEALPTAPTAEDAPAAEPGVAAGRLNRLFEYLAAHAEAIKNGSVERREDLASHLAWAMQRHSNTLQEAALSPQGKAFYDEHLAILGAGGEEKVEVFLKKKILHNDYWRYATEAGTLLKKLVATDKQKADEVFEHALQTVERSMRAQRNLSQSPCAVLVERMANSGTNDARLLQFLYRKALANNSLGSLQNLDHRVCSAFDQSFRGRQQQLRKQKIDNKEANHRALAETLAEYQKLFAGARPAAVTRSIRQAVAQLSRDQLSASAKEWAAVEGALVKEAGGLCELALLEQKGQRPIRLPKALVTHYQAILDDEALSAAGRYHAYLKAAEQLRRYEGLEPLVVPAVRLFLAAQDKRSVTVRTLQQPAAALNSAPTDEAWKEVALAFIKLWERQKRVQPHHGTSLAPTIAELHFKLEQPEKALALLSRKQFGLAGQPATYAIPLKYGKADWCRERLVRHWREVKCSQHVPEHLALTAETRRAADALIPAMPSEDLRFFAKVLYASFPLRKVKPDRGRQVAPQQERMAKLAEQLASRKFEQDEIRKKCIDFLLRDPYFEKLKPVVYEVCAKDNLLAIAFDNTPQKHMRQTRFMKYLGFLLDDGDVTGFQKQVERLKPGLAMQQSWNAVHTLNAVHQVFVNTLRNEKTPLKGGRADYLKLAKRLHGIVPGGQGHYHSRELFPALVSLHYLCGQAEQLKDWLNNLPEEERKRYRGQLHHHQYLPMFRKALAPITEENATKLLELCLASTIDPSLAPYLSRVKGAHQYFVQQPPFNNDRDRWQLFIAEFYAKHGRADLAAPIATNLSRGARKPEIKGRAKELLQDQEIRKAVEQSKDKAVKPEVRIQEVKPMEVKRR